MLKPLLFEGKQEKPKELKCPKCKSRNFFKVGKERGKQEYQCKDCQRRFIENPQCQSASDILPPLITIEEMFEFDIWDLRVFGLKPSVSNGYYTLNFSSISCQWLKNAVKHWLKYRISIDKTATICIKLTHLKDFAKFLESHYPNLLSQQISRNIIVGYLAYLTKCKKSSSTRINYIGSLNQFLDSCGRFDWVNVPKERLIYPEDYPKRSTVLPRFIPEEVKKQIEDNLDALPEPIACMVKILWQTGMRVSEVCNLKFDSVRQDATGAWWIDVYQIKMKKQIPPIIIALDLAVLIHKQQQYIRKHLGQDYPYLFCETKGNGWFQKKYSGNGEMRCKPKQLKHFVPVPKKMYHNTLRGYLVQFAEEREIRDASGKIFPLARLHQFRHTHGTELINNGVPQHIVQKRLGHKSPTMTMQYAHIHDETMKREMERFWDGRVVNINGEVIISENPDLDTAEMQWIKKNMKAQALPNGFCGLPITLNCPVQGSPCLFCPHFRTTKEHLEVHQKQLKNTEKLIENARAKDWQRQVETNLPIAENLKKIISGLEGGRQNA